MCTTFVVRCMCGHEFHRKVMKCAQAIRSQLDLAETDIDEDSSAARNGCVCEIDSPEEYLKPDICEHCKNKGLVCDYLINDPGAKFEIVKGWLAQRRTQKMRRAGEDLNEDADMMEDPEIIANSSASSAIGIDPRTPTPRTRPSDIHILELDQDFGEAGLMTISPISDCITTRVNLFRKNLDQIEPKFKDDNPHRVFKHVQSPDEVHDLKLRAAALKEKLHHLIAENKHRRGLEVKD